jgi:hypothetical protein
LRWDGTRWLQVYLPDFGPPESTNITLNSVAAFASNDVWIAGSTDAFTTDPYPHREFKSVQFILRWDGKIWQKVPLPGPGMDLSVNAIAGNSSHDIWAVGTYSGIKGPALVWHWDGTLWSVAGEGTPGAYNTLNSVTLLSSGRIWAGGSYGPTFWKRALAVEYSISPCREP